MSSDGNHTQDLGIASIILETSEHTGHRVTNEKLAGPAFCLATELTNTGVTVHLKKKKLNLEASFYHSSAPLLTFDR